MFCMVSCFLLAMRRARAALFFSLKEERGHKKAFDLPQGRRRRQDGTDKKHRRDSTPILSVARQSPGPHSPGLDERKKAGLLTSGSSYSLRLTARLRAVASWSFRRPLQRRYRTGFTPVSLFSSRHCGRHFLAGWSRRGGTISKNWKREYGFAAGTSRAEFLTELLRRAVTGGERN